LFKNGISYKRRKDLKLIGNHLVIIDIISSTQAELSNNFSSMSPFDFEPDFGTMHPEALQVPKQ
jgi:hypothetical protein